MAHPRPEKVAEVEALEQRLRSSSVVIVTDYRGLSVAEIGTLRLRLRDASLEYRVAKNTLLIRAAEQAGVPGLAPFLSGPTAIVFGKDDPGVPARVLQEFIRQFRKLEIKGGVVEGQALGAAAVQSLATLPTRPELLGRVAGMIQSPLRGLVGVLSAPPRALVMALDAIRKQRETSGRPTTGSPAGEAAAPAVEPAASDEPAATPAASGAETAAPAGEPVAPQTW